MARGVRDSIKRRVERNGTAILSGNEGPSLAGPLSTPVSWSLIQALKPEPTAIHNRLIAEQSVAARMTDELGQAEFAA